MNPDVLLSLIHDKQQEVLALRQQLEHLRQQVEMQTSAREAPTPDKDGGSE